MLCVGELVCWCWFRMRLILLFADQTDMDSSARCGLD
jgi:hypothetical protein